MTRNIQSDKKLEDFINKLTSSGCSIQSVSKRPQIYSINGELFNIRCREKSKNIAGGRGFWYSVSFNVLQEVKWVIYITTTSDYFYLFPSSFLESRKDQMYSDKRKAGVGVFDLDYDNEMMVLKQGALIHIGEYYFNLIYEDDFPMVLNREK